jgi:molybdenum cofactor guanylyltransferase
LGFQNTEKLPFMTFESFILIGGKSSRMGEDKFSLRLNGKTFLEIASETFRHFGSVSVVGSDQTKFDENFLIVKDIYKNRGALGGIHAASIHSKSDFTIISACDYPFVSGEMIRFMTNMAETETEFEAVVPVQSDGRIQPLCAVYKTESCRKILSEMLKNEDKNYSARDFLNRIKTRYIDFTEIAHLQNSEQFFFNVNTPEDFISAAKLRKTC